MTFAQNLSSMMGILLKAKMKMSFVKVRKTMMRLTLIEATFLIKTPVEHIAFGKGPTKALSKSRNIGKEKNRNI